MSKGNGGMYYILWRLVLGCGASSPVAVSASRSAGWPVIQIRAMQVDISQVRLTASQA